MRVWEIEDNRALPSDLVLEQDFILRIRRLQRMSLPHLVANFLLNNRWPVDGKSKELREAGDKLQEFAKLTNGQFAAMSNGDAFIVWEDAADTELLINEAVEAIGLSDKAGQEEFIHRYRMPQDYMAIRERINDYIEIVRSSSAMAVIKRPSEALKSEAARGPLTAWGVDQIGKLLGEIDVQRFGRTQVVYRHHTDGSWSAVAEEHYIGLEDLRREHFPKLDIIAPEHLFLALCEVLDQRLLEGLIENFTPFENKPLNLNLSVASVMGSVFARFTHIVPKQARKLVGFELHRGDWLQDFSLTLNAITILHREGFRIIFDGITPDMLPYLNLNAFDVEGYKINASKDYVPHLLAADAQKALKQIPPEKITFFRCDNEKSLAFGLQAGISLFQGWLIDEKVQGKI